ncbi:MAG TPA: fumarylacetoacetate hydrolase family protein [Candidatus Dormibacteraeota bacterium]|nr:fumarylacetoacetate hydrolase family protein [Candidatus Dormibacteraeota bacterium]
MRYVSYFDDAFLRPGALTNDRVAPIACDDMRSFIALSPAERSKRIESPTLDARKLRLGAPLLPPRNVFCVGRNYLDHALEGARASGRELKLPDVPTFFTKATTAVIGPGATVHFDASISSQYDFEAELAIVIGERCRDVREERAHEVIFGYTCCNDLTARDLQREHVQWMKGKSLDESCPLGPAIVGSDELRDPQSLEIAMFVNDVEKQRSTTAKMIFSIPRIIAELSRGMTLLPGDVIATGTPEGVGFARTPPEFLRDGDRLEVRIESIGSLFNTISLTGELR